MLWDMSQPPRCIFCGTPRSAEVPQCPKCGSSWIDATIDEATASPPTRQTILPENTKGNTILGKTSQRHRRWLFPLLAAVIVATAYGITFAVFINRSDSNSEQTDMSSAMTATTTELTEISTTSAPTEVATTETTQPETTQPETTTSTQPPIPEVGDAIPLEDLTLGAFALGPLTFGDQNVDALGRLVATFGQPDDLRNIGESDGLCPTDTGRTARFGWLTVYLRNELEIEVLVGYRVESPTNGSAGEHPTSELRTISGAAIGDTVPDWNDTYKTSIVVTALLDGTPHLLLLRSSDERTLLWGPLDIAGDPSRLIGIYSPRPCDGGPFYSD